MIATSRKSNACLVFLPSATKLRRLCLYTCLSVHRGGLPQCMLGYHPWSRIPPRSRHPPRTRQPPKQLVLRTVHILLECILVTGHNEVVAKVIFLHLFVILFTRGCLPQCMLGWHTPSGSRHPQEQTPPKGRHPPRADLPGQTPSSRADTPGTDAPKSRHPPSRHPPEQTPPTPPGSRLRHTVNERPVRILLECILVTCANTPESSRN